MLVPSHPIYKKNYMSALLLHDRLERIDEGRWKKSRTLCQCKEAEGKEAVDALAEAGNHKGPLRIARTQVFRFRCQRNAGGLHEIGKNLLVPPLLKALEPARPPQPRAADQIGIAQH